MSPIFYLPTPIGRNQFYEHKQTMTKNLTLIHNPRPIPSLCLYTYRIEKGAMFMVLLLFGSFLLVVMDYSSVWVCPEKIIQHLQILNFSSFPLEIEEYNLPFEPYPSSSNVFHILLLHIQNMK
jgi:hypothetical protein